MANSGIVVINAVYSDNGHGSQLARMSSIAAKDVYPWESPQGNVLSMALTSLQIDLSCLFQ